MPRRKRRTQSDARKKISKTLRPEVTAAQENHKGASMGAPLRILPLPSEQRQNFAASTDTSADGALVCGAGLHVLRTERNAANLLAGVETRGRHADRLSIFVERSGERPARLGKNHAVAPAVEINGEYVAIEIEIAASQHAIQIRSERILVAGKRRGQ